MSLLLAFAVLGIGAGVFFVIRYQFLLLRNLERSMARIADAVEAIAQRR